MKNERDKKIESQSKSYTLEYVIAATQILTIMWFIKGNPAWKGSLSLLFFGAAFMLFYKYQQYTIKLYRHIGIVCFVIGTGLMLWFGITG